MPQALLPLCVIIPLRMVDCSVFLRCLPLLGTALSREKGSLGLKFQTPTLLPLKHPTVPFPWSSAGPHICFPTERSPSPCPASLPPLQRLTSRSHLFYPLLCPLILRKLMAKAFPDSQAICAAVSLPHSAGKVEMSSLGE